MILGFIKTELIVALFLLGLGIALNIIAGGLKARLKESYDKEVLMTGVRKGIIIIILSIGLSLAFSIDDSLVFDDVPIIEYLIIAIKAAYVFYYGQVLTKIIEVITTKEEQHENI